MKNMSMDDSLTNDHRTGFHRTLCRMLIALRYRSETRNYCFIVVERRHSLWISQAISENEASSASC